MKDMQDYAREQIKASTGKDIERQIAGNIHFTSDLRRCSWRERKDRIWRTVE